jgi:GxxExxY protein
MQFDELSRRVIGCALEVHKALGPGLLESAYESCLARELKASGIPFVQQMEIPLTYKGTQIECGYRADLVVDSALLVELKSIDALLPIHQAQLLTYMKLANVQTGLLINFNVPLLKDGIKRMVL